MTSTRFRVALATTTSVLATVLAATAANADCLPSANPLVVTCDGLGTTGGYQTTSDAVTISVTAAGTVASSGLAAGANSVVNNNGTVNNSITLGANGTVANASNATGNGTSGGGAGGITGTIAFGSAGTGQVNTLNNNTSSATLIGVIKGSAVTSAGNTVFNNQGFFTGSFTQTGTGSVAINNASAFTGATFTGDIVTAGDTTLTNGAGATITGNITMGAGTDIISNTGTITGNVDMGGGTNTYNASGQAQLPSGTLTAAATSLSTLNLSGSALTDTVSQPVTNFTFVNKSGTGTWTIAAPITLNTVPATPVGQTNFNVTGGILSVDDADYLVGPNNSVTVGTGANLTFNGTAAGTYSGVIGGAGTVTVGTGAGATTFSGANTFAGGTTVDGGTLIVTGGSALLDTGAVTVQNGGTFAVSASETVGALGDAGTGTNIVSIASGQTLTVGSGNFGSAGGNIQGAGGLTKTTTGTFALSGANTFTGPLTVTDGIVAVTGGTAIGDTTAVVVNATAATATVPATTGEFDVNGSETIGSLAGNGGKVVLASGQTLTTGDATNTSYAGVISGAGGLTKDGTGTFTLAGANTYSGGTTVADGTLEGNTTSLQGAFTVAASGTLLFTQPTDGIFAGAISGAGTTTKAGAGVLTLTGDNSGFTGTTNLNGGAVSIAAATNIGAGPLAFDGGTLTTTTALTLANDVTLNAGGGTFQTTGDTTLLGVVSGAGRLTKTGAGTLFLGGEPLPYVFNTFTGGITISAGTLQAAVPSLNNNDIVDNGALVIDNAGNSTFSGSISGTGSLTVFRFPTNVLTLTGNNTYSGPTFINAGAVYASTGTGIGDLSAVTVASGAEFEIGGGAGPVTETIGSLAGAGDFSVNDPGDHLITGGNNSSTAFSGDATGGQIEKVGTGVFTVSGTGNLSSGLTVTAGTLAIADGGDYTATTTVATGATLDVQTGEVGGLLTGNLTTAAGSFAKVNGQVVGDVTNAGTLSGNGTVTGTVTNSGNVAPGNSPGVMTVNGAYVQTATGTYTAEINGSATPVAGTDYDRIAVTGTPGTATLGGTLAVVKSTATNYVAGAKYDIVTTTGGITGNFATVTGNVVSPFITLSNTTANGGGIVSTAGGDVYRLVLVRTNYSTAALTPNQTAVANGLQSLVGNTAATATVTALDNMSATSAQTLFDQASPESYGAYATAIEDQSNLFTRQVALQMTGSAAQTGKAVWLNGYGQWGSGSNDRGLIASDQDITGIAGGVNFGINGLAAGVVGGYSEDKVNFRRGSASGKSKAWQVGGYIAYDKGALGADVQVSYAHGDVTTRKSVNAGSGASLITGTADGSTTSEIFRAIGTVGYNLTTTGVRIRPFVGVDYSSGHVNGFTETGFGTLNLKVSRFDAGRTDVLGGVKLGGSFGGLAPYANLTYRYRTDGDGRLVSGAFLGGAATPFSVNTLRSGRSQGDVDAGLRYAAGSAVTVFLGYEGTFRNDVTEHGVNGGVRVNF